MHQLRNSKFGVGKVICIVGPTGVGKSAISLYLSQKYNGVIINADSRQVYIDFPIVTAQPSLSEQLLIQHKLYGYLHISEKISAGLWSSRAIQEIHNVWKSDMLPIVVGGTGMYFRALFDGIVSIPAIPSHSIKKIEEKYRSYGLSQLYAELKNIDPLYAETIHHNDQQRILRALMVFEATAKPFSLWHKDTPLPSIQAEILRVGIKRSLSELTPYLIRRIDTMLAQGARQEVSDAYEQCSDETVPGWSSIGCMELLGEIKGCYTQEEAKSLWLKNTRSYAKRQLTWFNADKRIQWFHPEEAEKLYICVDQWLQNT